MDSSASFRAPPPPSLPGGSIPAQRLQTQPVSEPPACVQNAMMTKDKKPFTYTPGGIDLSQIKSPRMAKRIARNAQYEGVTGQPKPSPLAQQNAAQNPPAPLAASALGMPVQVFPTGPPPPPPAPIGGPAPPPPPPKNHLAPQTNGNARKSPTPQNFEPPPMGCRPEIKIPPNPMASLKKVPKPQEKNDFWIEEYRKERSKSPLVTDDVQENNVGSQPEIQQPISPPKPELSPKPNIAEQSYDPRMDPNRIAFQQARAAQQTQQASPQVQTPQDVNRLPYQQQQQQQSQASIRSPSPPKQQRSIPIQQRPTSPIRTPAGPYQPPQRVQQTQPRVDSPFQTQDNPNLQRPLSPNKSIPSASQQSQQAQPTYYIRQHQQQQQPQPQQQYNQRQGVTSPTMQPKPAQVGSIYIPPVAPENLAINKQQDQRSTPTTGSQQTPPWLAVRPNMKEIPEWVREENDSQQNNRTQTPPITTNQGNPGLRLQMTIQAPSNAKERIIPIQIEKTPTPTRTPSTPGFGPQPYYANNQQYGSVASPASGMPPSRNPNQFVDQGYNNFSNNNQWSASPPVQQMGGNPGTRIVPISIERQDSPFSPNAVKGPISQSPTVIQNGSYRFIIHDCPLEAQLRYSKSRLSDPRSLQHQQSWGNGAPNQSKSFRILQKITDTDANKDTESEQPAELQRPQYSRQMGSVSNDGVPSEQMRRMQLHEQNQAFLNQTPMPAQPQRFIQQRPMYQQDDQPQQPYIHPSEQQVPEPKKYTGSAIPSRSFRLLQAMTTPENAGPGQSDL